MAYTAGMFGTGVTNNGFSSNWQVYPGYYNLDLKEDVALYNATTGTTVVEFANGTGGWNTGPVEALPKNHVVVPGGFVSTVTTSLLLYGPDASLGTAVEVYAPDYSGGWNTPALPIAVDSDWTKIIPGFFGAGPRPATPTPTPSPSPSPTPSPTPTRSPSPTPTNTAPAALAGDLNCDGAIDDLDVAVFLDVFVGLPSGVPPDCHRSFDLDCSGHVDGDDALVLMRYIVGLPLNLPPDCPAPGTPVAV